MNVEIFKNLLYSVADNCYVCKNCGKLILPNIGIENNEEVNVESTQYEIRGGIGNKEIINPVCEECYNRYFR